MSEKISLDSSELRKKNDGDEKNFIDRGGQPDSLRYS